MTVWSIRIAGLSKLAQNLPVADMISSLHEYRMRLEMWTGRGVSTSALEPVDSAAWLSVAHDSPRSGSHRRTQFLGRSSIALRTWATTELRSGPRLNSSA